MALPPDNLPDETLPARPREAAWREFAAAPLVPPALAVTAGLALDRYAEVPTALALALGAVALALRLFAPDPRLRSVGLLALFAALGAAYHHQHRHDFPADDVGQLVTREPRLLRLRGTLSDDPASQRRTRTDALQPVARTARDTVVMEVTGVESCDGWRAASGAVRLSVEREPAGGDVTPRGLQLGDLVEVFGVAWTPGAPKNPGEADYREYLADRRVRAEMHLSEPHALTRLAAAPPSPGLAVAVLRRWASGAIRENVAPGEAGTAAALLLGDGAAMERAEWDVYVRTGVVHALAISGQHLAVLAGFLWLVLRLAGVGRVRGAGAVLAVVVVYTLVTGLRPSGVRACVMVAAACGGLVARRPTLPANSLALGWLAIVLLNPTDPFSLGCRFSFLSVFVLVWGLGPMLLPRPLSPLGQLIDESRAPLERLLRRALGAVRDAYAITLGITAVNAPILLAEQNTLSPGGLLVGPVIVGLTSLALVLGFLMIVTSPLPWLAGLVAAPVGWLLQGCERVAHLADALPGGVVYHAGPPAWWLVGFYVGVGWLVLGEPRHQRRVALGLLAWVGLALAWPGTPQPPGELRVTFLAVGKGGCVVLETPDGRCLLYDAGTTAGPQAVRRVVAPFLWSRGVHRIDEVFVSHADSDHFNGIAELARRFPIGQVTLTPSFADKPSEEVAAALRTVREHAIPSRLAHVGHTFAAGGVTLEVRHPPKVGPPGTENERSLVLLVTHGRHRILLTGDLEKGGTSAVLAQPIDPVDVLLAPHHGSRAASPAAVAAWCRPRLVVVSRGPALGNSLTAADLPGAPPWDTFADGAVTVRSGPGGLTAEAFATGERRVLSRDGAR